MDCKLYKQAVNIAKGAALAALLLFLVPDAATAQTREADLEKASKLMLAERWQAAKNIYDDVLKYDADNFTALYFRAFANERLLHYGLARADYDHILRLDPLNYHALMGRATLNQKDSRLTEAIDDANLLVECYKDSLNSWLTRADIEEKQKLYALAEYDYEHAYSLEPTTLNHITKAIDLKLRQGKKEDAKRWLDRLVRGGVPKNSLLYYYKQINLRNP